MNAQQMADRINLLYPVGADFAGAYHSWAGCPWRPGDTMVSMRRCWAEGEVLYIETTPPYAQRGDEPPFLAAIHDPVGMSAEPDQSLVIQEASKVVVDGVIGLPPKPTKKDDRRWVRPPAFHT